MSSIRLHDRKAIEDSLSDQDLVFHSASLARVNADLTRQVSQTWAAVLGCPVDEETEFFAAGGDSMMAMRIIGQLSADHEVKLPLRLLFDNPRCGDFAAALDEFLRVRHPADAAS
jgi:acyl carrier protein